MLHCQTVKSGSGLLQKEDIDKSKGELRALEQKAAEQQHKVETAQRDVDQIKDKLANLPSAPASTKPQQDELQMQMKDLQNQVDMLQLTAHCTCITVLCHVCICPRKCAHAFCLKQTCCTPPKLTNMPWPWSGIMPRSELSTVHE